MPETSVLDHKEQRKTPRCYAALKSPNEIYYQMASIFHAIKKDKKKQIDSFQMHIWPIRIKFFLDN